MNKKNRFGSVLVITYGRSGSTLLQGILNSIPGYLIRGENENFIFGFYQAYKLIKFSNFYDLYKKQITTPQHPWYGFEDLDLTSFCDDVRKLIKKQIIANKDKSDYYVYGFKEIRYMYVQPSELEKYLDFLNQVFDRPAFIFNFRKIDDVLNSGHWKNQDSELLRKKIVDFEKACLKYINRNKDFCFLNCYDDLIDLKSGQASRLFEFLQEPYREASFSKVLNIKHSDGNRKHFSSCDNISDEIKSSKQKI